MRTLPVILSCLAAAFVAGCGSGAGANATGGSDGALFSCATETRAMPYVAGMMRTSTSGAFAAALMASEPPPPAKGNESWTVQILDAQGAPADGLTVKATPFMPDHNHGTSVKATVTPAGGGMYSIAPLYFFMAGYWEVTLTVQPVAGAPDTVLFPVCIMG